MFCGNCGKQIRDAAKFCPYCGASVKMRAPTPAPFTEESIPAAGLAQEPVAQDGLPEESVAVDAWPEEPVFVPAPEAPQTGELFARDEPQSFQADFAAPVQEPTLEIPRQPEARAPEPAYSQAAPWQAEPVPQPAPAVQANRAAQHDGGEPGNKKAIVIGGIVGGAVLLAALLLILIFNPFKDKAAGGDAEADTDVIASADAALEKAEAEKDAAEEAAEATSQAGVSEETAAQPGEVVHSNVYTPYTNARFGFSLQVPAELKAQAAPSGGDGLSWQSTDGKVRLSASGINNIPAQSTAAQVESFRAVPAANGWSVTYEAYTETAATVSGYTDAAQTEIYYMHMEAGNGCQVKFVWIYPTDATYVTAWVEEAYATFTAGDLSVGH